jgi:aspartokinase
MTKDKNINRKVWNLIEKDLAVQKNLQKEVINIRALAKRIKERHLGDSSLHAIISAIRRFHVEKEFQKVEDEIRSIFKDSVISTQNKITCITVKPESLDFLGAIKKLKAKNVVKITSGNENAKIILASSEKNKLLEKIHKKDIVNTETNLSEIVIRLDPKATYTKGVLARIANELALKNINMREFIASLPEIIIYVAEEDAPQAYETLLSLA